MGFTSTEACFPRGGSSGAPALRKSTFSIFGKKRAEKKKKKSKPGRIEREVKKKMKKPVEAAEWIVNHVQPLTYQTLSPGLCLLGCVREVRTMHLNVSLPCHLDARVPITNISVQYSRLLQALADGSVQHKDCLPLACLFRIGQVVSCCVTRVSTAADGQWNVEASLMPQQVNNDRLWATIAAGSTITAAVQSCEDHGYCMDCGIDSVRAFLPADQAVSAFQERYNGGRPLAVGQVLRCVVTQAAQGTSYLTIRLSIDADSMSRAVLTAPHLSVHHLYPGARIHVTIERVLDNGLEVALPSTSNEPHQLAYIESAQLVGPWDTPTCYVGRLQPIGATVLYILPVLNLAYLSLRNYSFELSLPQHKTGALLQKAKVHSAARTGVYLKLDKNQLKGFVPMKRLGAVIDAENIPMEFPEGKVVATRVLFYDFMEQLNICTLEKNLLTEKHLTSDSLCIGDKMSAIVKSVSANGAVVSFGCVNAFVPRTHLSDVPLPHERLLLRVHVNSRVNARILSMDSESGSVIATLKPTLVSQAEVLTSYGGAKRGVGYYGTICNISATGLVVAFFGSVTGVVPPSQRALSTKFKIGQLVKCYVVSVNESAERLFLSHNPVDADWEALPKWASVGVSAKLVVTDISPAGLAVITESESGKELVGEVPREHLTDHPSLAESLLATYTIGQMIETSRLYQIQETERRVVFSLRRSVQRFCEEYEEFLHSERLQLPVGTILPCSIVSVSCRSVELYAPLPNYAHKLFAPLKELSKKMTTAIPELSEGSILFAVVKRMKRMKQAVGIKCHPYEMLASDPQCGVDYFTDYLLACSALQSVRPGDKVVAFVTSVEESRACVSLKQSCLSGVVYDTDCKKGDEVTSTVLWQDPVTKLVHLSLKEKFIKANQTEGICDVRVGETANCIVVASLPQLSVAVLTGQHKGRLAWLPTRQHPNQLQPQGAPKLRARHVVHVQRIEGQFVVCITQKTLEKLNSKIDELKRIKKAAKMEKSAKASLNSCKGKTMERNVREKRDLRTKIRGNFNNTNKKAKQIKIDKPLNEVNCTASVLKKGQFINLDVNKQRSGLPVKLKRKKSPDSLEVGCEDVSNVEAQIETQKLNLRKEYVENHSEGSPEKKKKSCNNLPNKEIFLKDNVISLKKDGKAKKLLNMCRGKKKKIAISEKGIKKSDQKGNECSFTKCGFKGDETGTQKKITHISTTERETQLPRLSLGDADKFIWDMKLEDLSVHVTQSSEESEQEEDKEEKPSKKKRKRMSQAEKLKLEREEEKKIREMEEEMLQAQENPQSADQFDRLVMAEPNNSVIWIKYMAFHLQATEIERARAVARRAIQTISHLQDQERLNIWIALLNIENLYGTQESLKGTMEEALRCNDTFHIHSRMLDIYADSKSKLELEQLANMMARKYRDRYDSYLHCLSAMMKCGLEDKARCFLERATPPSLSKQAYVDLICQFALLENRYSHPEEAKTLLESILTSYPARVDIWSIYSDMLVKNGNIELARQVLERSVVQKLPPRKMKTLYAKWLGFEERHGSTMSVERVKHVAQEYVNTITSKLE